MTKPERRTAWLVAVGLVLAMFVVVRVSSAADPICLDPPPSDQRFWDGRTGTLSYCTPANVVAFCSVTFDGVDYDPCASPGADVSTRIDCPTPAGATGEAAAVVRCENPLGGLASEVAATATFPVQPEPAYLLPGS